MNATSQQSIQDAYAYAYAYVSAAFPLNRTSAIAARVIARAFQIPGVDQFVFNAMLAHSDRQRKKR